MTRVTPPDLELFLTGAVRAAFQKPRIDLVSNKEPAGTFPPALVVIRDDSGPKTSAVTFERTLGVSVLAGTKTYDVPANNLARDVFAFLTSDEIVMLPGSPIAAVLQEQALGPFAVDEPQDRARRYFTVGYSVLGGF